MALTFSICVPSRNRQAYFQETIRALTASPRSDIEFVFTDNSDDPQIMKQFMKAYRHDRRITFIPSGKSVYSMVDNWERTVAASKGDWVTVIGDDDYVDPELVTVLNAVLAVKPDLEAFEWGRVAFDWPLENVTPNTNVSLNLSAQFYDITREAVLARAFLWQGAVLVPNGGFSIYHAALSRPLLERIRKAFGGRYFEHPTVDYDNAFKVAIMGTSFASCSRTFSVLGACPQSNSGSLRDRKRFLQRVAEFKSDLGFDLDDDPLLADMPFRIELGLTACVVQVQHWLKQKYNFHFPGWEKTFAECCARCCQLQLDRDLYDWHVEGYRRAFSIWEGGAYLEHFRPEFQAARAAGGEPMSGMFKDRLQISMAILNPPTPLALYRILDAMLVPAGELSVSFDGRLTA